MEKKKKGDLCVTLNLQAIYEQRLSATDGKVERALGVRGPFSESFKNLIRSDCEGILQSEFLVKDLKMFKHTLNALNRDPHHNRARDLSEMFSGDPGRSGYDSILCPLARQVHGLNLMTGATRYFFPEVRNQLYFLTVVMDFAPDLETLAKQIGDARLSMQKIGEAMTNSRRGIVMFGTFEPDLRSGEDFIKRKALSKAAGDLGWVVDDAGGWVLSSHLIVRAVDVAPLKAALKKTFPANGWRRVHLRPFDRNKTVLGNLLKLVKYVSKASPSIGALNSGNVKMDPSNLDRNLRTTVLGPQVPVSSIPDEIDRDHAIRQLAIFLHDTGFDKLTFSYESGYAQEWYTHKETLMFLNEGWLENLHGYCKVEVHRSDDTHGPKPRRVTRELTYKSADVPEPTRVYVGTSVGISLAI
ncbi:hypothetical protein SAMN05444336_1113 [Albimonas donghaensis]|uniref:Uncharacterized protein n=1 Tax=Albimonas donghaensis TaxID=356660 RepID=A0A1H3EUB1_9RHOB|nr:hypothetical protein [Albimonas donghaensis]SDX82372.1 hypothetical protein SAMN05444336_1113 [Albimonas donghaensis]